MTQYIPAIFFDRDGTINIDYGYIYKINHFQFINGVIHACKKLKEMGFLLVLITNQSGIARGKFSEKQFYYLIHWMNQSLANFNVYLDGIYFCPHHPEAKIEIYRKECNCRKPYPGMLLKAMYELRIDMEASYMIGDQLKDIQAAQTAGVGTKILVRTGNSLIKKDEKFADWVLNSFVDLPEAIKKHIT